MTDREPQGCARLAAVISQHNAQKERVKASLTAQVHPDTYARRKPRPGPIQPPTVDRSSWTSAA